MPKQLSQVEVNDEISGGTLQHSMVHVTWETEGALIARFLRFPIKTNPVALICLFTQLLLLYFWVLAVSCTPSIWPVYCSHHAVVSGVWAADAGKWRAAAEADKSRGGVPFTEWDPNERTGPGELGWKLCSFFIKCRPGVAFLYCQLQMMLNPPLAVNGNRALVGQTQRKLLPEP